MAGTAQNVFEGRAEGFENRGNVVTASFVRRAQQALHLAQTLGIRVAVLKESSPSCGVLKVYDGEFSGQMRSGRGVTAELLCQHGVQVFSEQQSAEAQAFLAQLED
ncbi:hypothetical protein DESA109040_10210 [Deinococcus saxicola]|uniref:DUF523 domain-containing protein n=1 Tax=Deinococcus saxicola TaxID=249406 RepID=UPI0039F02266